MHQAEGAQAIANACFRLASAVAALHADLLSTGHIGAQPGLPLTVAINLSPAQMARSDRVGLVRAALAESRLPARRLELEINESILMNNTEGVLGQLRELSAIGVSIAMDDFGTGYSSLAYPWRSPFDKVKIDRAFTQCLEVPA